MRPTTCVVYVAVAGATVANAAYGLPATGASPARVVATLLADHWLIGMALLPLWLGFCLIVGSRDRTLSALLRHGSRARSLRAALTASLGPLIIGSIVVIMALVATAVVASLGGVPTHPTTTAGREIAVPLVEPLVRWGRAALAFVALGCAVITPLVLGARWLTTVCFATGIWFWCAMSVTDLIPWNSPINAHWVLGTGAGPGIQSLLDNSVLLPISVLGACVLLVAWSGRFRGRLQRPSVALGVFALMASLMILLAIAQTASDASWIASAREALWGASGPAAELLAFGLTFGFVWSVQVTRGESSRRLDECTLLRTGVARGCRRALLTDVRHSLPFPGLLIGATLLALLVARGANTPLAGNDYDTLVWMLIAIAIPGTLTILIALSAAELNIWQLASLSSGRFVISLAAIVVTAVLTRVFALPGIVPWAIANTPDTTDGVAGRLGLLCAVLVVLLAVMTLARRLLSRSSLERDQDQTPPPPRVPTAPTVEKRI